MEDSAMQTDDVVFGSEAPTAAPAVPSLTHGSLKPSAPGASGPTLGMIMRFNLEGFPVGWKRLYTIMIFIRDLLRNIPCQWYNYKWLICDLYDIATYNTADDTYSNHIDLHWLNRRIIGLRRRCDSFLDDKGGKRRSPQTGSHIAST